MPEHHSESRSGGGFAERPAAAFIAVVCAWLLPGLGHIVLGQRARGGRIMAGALFLIFSGMLIGGVDSVDRVDDRLWFYAQAVNGPIVLVADAVNQRYVKHLPPERQLDTKGLGRANEMGTLFIALAGLMNLAVIFDVVSRSAMPGAEAAA